MSEVVEVSPEAREVARRERILDQGLLVAGFASLAASLVLFTDPTSRNVTVAAAITGVIALVLRRFRSRLGLMPTLGVLMTMMSLTILMRAVLNNDLSTSAFWVGPAMILAAMILPRERTWIAGAYASAMCLIMWLATDNAPQELTGLMLMANATLIAFAVWASMRTLLGAIDEYGEDELAARMRVEELAAEIARSNEGLAEQVEARTAHLAAAVERNKELVEELREASMTDPRTGLRNLRHWDERLPGLISAAVESGVALSVACIDLDKFSEVNNTRGHSTGDAVLARVAEALRETLAEDDLLCRVGGEEFALALPGVGGQAAVERCEEFRRAVEGIDWSDIDDELRVTCSIGVYTAVPSAVASPPEKLARDAFWMADSGMLQAKAGGRNQVIAA